MERAQYQMTILLLLLLLWRIVPYGDIKSGNQSEVFLYLDMNLHTGVHNRRYIVGKVIGMLNIIYCHFYFHFSLNC